MDAERLPDYAGLVGGGGSLATTLTATLVAPWFDWSRNALSDLGATGEPTAPLFNGGLLVGGLVAAAFAWALYRRAGAILDRLAAVSYLGSAVALALVGAFPIGTAPHAPVAVAHFLLAVLTTWLAGGAAARAGHVRRGVAWVGLGVVGLSGWVALAAGAVPGGGIAVPEVLASVAFVTWVGWRTATLGAVSGTAR